MFQLKPTAKVSRKISEILQTTSGSGKTPSVLTQSVLHIYIWEKCRKIIPSHCTGFGNGLPGNKRSKVTLVL